MNWRAAICRTVGHGFHPWHTHSQFGERPPFIASRECRVCHLFEIKSPSGLVSTIKGPVVFMPLPTPATDGRERLPDRRMARREKVTWQDSHGNTRDYDVGFGFDQAETVREVFCTAAKTGSDLQGIIHDACIAISVALQRGARIDDVAKSFGELRGEGDVSGLPASPLGAIARAGAALEREIAKGVA